MKRIIFSIGLCLATTAVHAMPVSVLTTDERSLVVPVADQYRYPARTRYSGGYVFVPDPLIQRRRFCAFGSYVACVGSGMFCVDLCY